MKATMWAIEERYSDDSGVEFSVRYSAKDMTIYFMGGGSSEAQYPTDKLQWLIDALYAINSELPEKESKKTLGESA